MKNLKLLLAVLILGAGLIINGCEDDNNPVDPGPGATASGSFTLNGGGYDNQTVNIVGGGALYDSSQDETGVILYGVVNNDTATIAIAFPGNSTGNFTWSDTTSYLSFYTNISTIYLGVDGSTNITSYGNVGSNIAGNFSGTLSLFSADSINIDGSFSARRISDEGL